MKPQVAKMYQIAKEDKEFNKLFDIAEKNDDPNYYPECNHEDDVSKTLYALVYWGWCIARGTANKISKLTK